MNGKKRKYIIIMSIIVFTIGVCCHFRPRFISDYLPHEQPVFVSLSALEIPGTSFTEVNGSNTRDIYDEIIKMKIQPLILENDPSGYARYSILAQFSNSITNWDLYHIEYYPGVKQIQIYYHEKCVVTGKIPETEKIQHLLPSFPNSEQNYRTASE